MLTASGPAAFALRSRRPTAIVRPPRRATARTDTAPGPGNDSLTVIFPAPETTARTVSPFDPAPPPPALPPLPPPPAVPPAPSLPPALLASRFSHWSSVAGQLRT